VLGGRLKLNANESKALPGPGRRSLIVPLQIQGLIVGKQDKTSGKSSSSSKTLTVQEQHRDAVVHWLNGLIEKKSKDALEAYQLSSPTILEYFPDYLPLLSVELKALADQKPRDLHLINQTAESLIAKVDQTALAAHFGTKHSESQRPELVEVHKEFTQQKEILTNTCLLRARALLELVQKDEATHGEAFNEAVHELEKWVDLREAKHVDLYVEYLTRLNQHGKALQAINKAIKGHSNGPVEKKLYEIRQNCFDLLGWTHLRSSQQWLLLTRFPSDYPLM
jgi:hypothetical protein